MPILSEQLNFPTNKIRQFLFRLFGLLGLKNPLNYPGSPFNKAMKARAKMVQTIFANKVVLVSFFPKPITQFVKQKLFLLNL